MARLSFVGILAAAFSLAFTVAAVHTERMSPALPAGWSQAGPADPSLPITLHISLAYSNLDQLDSKLMSVATPGQPAYGQWLDKNAVDELFGPSVKASPAVFSWLSSHKISSLYNDGHTITFKTNVGTANALLNANYTNFINSDGRKAVRTPSFDLPDDIAEYVEFVEPSIQIGNVKAHIKVGERLAVDANDAPYHPNCSHVVTPLCLREMYGINDYLPDANSGSSVGIGAFLGDFASLSDLVNFEKKLGLPQISPNVVSINGGHEKGQPGATSTESDLDIQYASGMARGLPATEFVVDGSDYAIPDEREAAPNNYNEPWLTYYSYLLSLPNDQLPKVISNSFGDDEQTLDRTYAHRVCNMIGLLGLRGITVINSCGDAGAGAICVANDGLNTTRFTPEFPASCPYITSVGGTQGYPSEEAWSYGGGGFSNTFAAPSYQQAAVSSYIGNLSSDVQSYYRPFVNFSGRAYPDVSAHADLPYLLVYTEGEVAEVGGTSAAAPTFAGIVALLNDARLRAGKPTMGFLNPWLYAMGKTGFRDITKGGSEGCDGPDGLIKWASWNATEGWDPVTGWGTPEFDKMKELALGMY